ncbi:DUF3107 domain-containing protein [Trueperella bialowiezensis]|uniref:Protein of uncharacterized function (DUF3107) n=1 Tax=Trueperella bialowiezensis TaxID=312285 RepID=A0A3S4VBN5_9ACTO|nr:DUF3107 domain-containing protein [Trueperella bialowiezensis]VEI13950.1 Protein of uncharacterised function (DUF3107) [Trueperella bialowiezensis]
MEVNIGIRNVQRELTLDVNLSAEEISNKVQAALDSNSALTLEDSEGKVVIVPSGAIGYVEYNEAQTRRVGFGF